MEIIQRQCYKYDANVKNVSVKNGQKVYKYILIRIKSFREGLDKTRKKRYFHCGPSSRTISKSTRKEKTKQKTKGNKKN